MTYIPDANKKFQKEINSGTAALVLLCLLDQAEEPMYGYQIAKLMEAADPRVMMMKQGALYPVLRSLENSGLLSSQVDPSISGPPRRYYRITAAGKEALDQWTEIWAHTKAFVDKFLKEKKMFSDIDDYLSQLKVALKGSDRALIQDALADSEEFLSTAMEKARARATGAHENGSIKLHNCKIREPCRSSGRLYGLRKMGPIRTDTGSARQAKIFLDPIFWYLCRAPCLGCLSIFDIRCFDRPYLYDMDPGWRYIFLGISYIYHRDSEFCLIPVVTSWVGIDRRPDH